MPSPNGGCARRRCADSSGTHPSRRSDGRDRGGHCPRLVASSCHAWRAERSPVRQRAGGGSRLRRAGDHPDSRSAREVVEPLTRGDAARFDRHRRDTEVLSKQPGHSGQSSLHLATTDGICSAVEVRTGRELFPLRDFVDAAVGDVAVGRQCVGSEEQKSRRLG